MSRKNSAGSSITDLVGVTPAASLFGAVPPAWQFPTIGTQTFRAGEMVSLSGAVGAAIGLVTTPTDASGYGILGFAADNAASATSSFTGVYVALPGAVFQGNVGHATSALAQTAVTDLGQRYGLTSLSGRTYVDKGKTACSTALVRVIGFNKQDVVPCFYGRVYFTVAEEKIQINKFNGPTEASGGVSCQFVI